MHIILSYLDHGDWTKALQTAIPPRKLKTQEDDETNKNVSKPLADKVTT